MEAWNVGELCWGITVVVVRIPRAPSRAEEPAIGPVAPHVLGATSEKET